MAVRHAGRLVYPHGFPQFNMHQPVPASPPRRWRTRMTFSKGATPPLLTRPSQVFKLQASCIRRLAPVITGRHCPSPGTPAANQPASFMHASAGPTGMWLGMTPVHAIKATWRCSRQCSFLPSAGPGPCA